MFAEADSEDEGDLACLRSQEGVFAQAYIFLCTKMPINPKRLTPNLKPMKMSNYQGPVSCVGLSAYSWRRVIVHSCEYFEN